MSAEKAQAPAVDHDSFTCYLTTKTKYEDDSSARSSRSTSPMPEMQGYAPPSFEKQAPVAPKGNTLLLDFDSDDTNSGDSDPCGPVSRNEEANPGHEFKLLLDLDEQTDEFFSPSVASNNKTQTKTQLNDLDDLFAGLNQPKTVPTPANSTFDPFESLMQPTQSSKNSSFNNLNLFDTTRPLNATTSNSGSLNKMANAMPRPRRTLAVADNAGE